MQYGADGMCLNSATAVAGPTSPGKTDPDGFTRICAFGVCFENGEPITVWRNNLYMPGFDPTYRYFLSPMHVPVQLGSKAVEVAGGSTVNGTLVLQNAGSGSIDSQQFAISRANVASPWQIALKIATNKCIGPVGIGTGNGTPIEVQDCNGGANQAWSISGHREQRRLHFYQRGLASLPRGSDREFCGRGTAGSLRLQRQRPQPDVQGGRGVLRARCGRTVSG